MNIQELPISKLKPAAYNPRRDLQPGEPEYDRLKKIIDRFDLVEPLVWNKRTGNLVGGHQRLKILRARGDKKVQAVVVDLELQEEKALNIALNKATGDWDFPKLTDLLQELKSSDFDIEFAGFDSVAFDRLLNGPQLNNPDGSAGDFTEHYDVVVECATEQEQKQIYAEMTGQGHKCRLLIL